MISSPLVARSARAAARAVTSFWNRLRGAFGAVITDGRRVWAVRDHVGFGTLFYRHDGGTFYAVSGRCPHANGPLGLGWIEEGEAVCPRHRWRFRLKDGAVMRGPATFPQLRLQARERQGQIEVRGRKG